VSVASYGWNKRNINIFTSHLQDVLNSRPFTSRNPDFKHNPKSIKARAIRVFAYFFSLLFIGIGILFLREVALGPAITLVALGTGYIYLDLRNR
jgi:hypothetical protein